MICVDEQPPVNGVAREGTVVTCVDQQSGGKTAEYLYELKRLDTAIRVRVVRRRRKSMALYVEKGILPELRVPTNCAWHEIHHFLGSKFDWILAAESELAARITAPPNRYHHGGKVSYLGKRYPLVIAKSRFSVVEVSEDNIYVSCNNPTRVQAVERQVMAWYRRQAESLFKERIAEVSGRFVEPVNPSGITVRKMKARWGSCSSEGEICLNLLLVKADLSQIDFVIAHELCHLRHFAHNKRFYQLLDEVMPDWRDQEARLKQAV